MSIIFLLSFPKYWGFGGNICLGSFNWEILYFSTKGKTISILQARTNIFLLPMIWYCPFGENVFYKRMNLSQILHAINSVVLGSDHLLWKGSTPIKENIFTICNEGFVVFSLTLPSPPPRHIHTIHNFLLEYGASSKMESIGQFIWPANFWGYYIYQLLFSLDGFWWFFQTTTYHIFQGMIYSFSILR